MERKHGHLLNVTRVLLFQSNLPKTFWSYAVSHSVFLINRLATPVLNHKTPFELLHGIPPTFLDLKVFGCLSYASTLLQNKRKLDPRARKCIFLGFKHGTKGYLLYDWHTRDIFISRNAIFFESIFPYHPNTLQDSTQDASDQQEYQLLFDTPNPISTDSSSSFTKQASQEPNQSSIEAPAPAASEPAAIQPRRSTRQSKAPTYRIFIATLFPHLHLLLLLYILSLLFFPIINFLHLIYILSCPLHLRLNQLHTNKPSNMNIGSRPCTLNFKH